MRAASASWPALAPPRVAPALGHGLLLAVVLFGLSLPLGDVLASSDRLSASSSLQVDAATYDALAASLAGGASWRTIPVRQPPGFVAILAAIYAVFGHSYLAAKLLLWACLIAATALAAWLARAVWGPRAAWTAALLTATAPALRHYTGTVQYEVLVAAQLLAALAVLTMAVHARRRRALLAWTLLAAITTAALVLTREVFAGVVPILAVWLGVQTRRHVGAGRAGVLGAAFLVLALAPAGWWSAAQSSREGALVLMSDKGPVTFALGNNPRASGTYDHEAIAQPSGLRFVRERPQAALAVFARKAMYFWGVIRDPWNVPRPAGLWLYRATGGMIPLDVSLPLARGGWVLLACLGGLVAFMRGGAWRQWWIVPAVIGAVWTAHVLTLSSHRFAVPILPLAFVFAAGPVSAAAAGAARWLSQAPWRVAGAIAVSVLAVAFQWLVPAPPAVAFAAADLDAMNAVNVVAVSGQRLRTAPAADGVRAAMILSDEYFARGRYQVRLTAARSDAALAPDLPVARVTVMSGDGTVRCREDVPAGLLPTGLLGDVWVPCVLRADGPATLVVEALGRTDLSFGDVAFLRAPGP